MGHSNPVWARLPEANVLVALWHLENAPAERAEALGGLTEHSDTNRPGLLLETISETRPAAAVGSVPYAWHESEPQRGVPEAGRRLRTLSLGFAWGYPSSGRGALPTTQGSFSLVWAAWHTRLGTL